MKNLHLSLKAKWFEMTKSGVKTEDYREITPYWVKKLMLYQNNDFLDLTKKDIDLVCSDFKQCTGADDFQEGSDIDYTLDNWYLSFKKFKTTTLTLDYPKADNKEKIIQFVHKGIEIRTGNPEWGAEPNKIYFVIKHGGKL